MPFYKDWSPEMYPIIISSSDEDEKETEYTSVKVTRPGTSETDFQPTSESFECADSVKLNNLLENLYFTFKDVQNVSFGPMQLAGVIERESLTSVTKNLKCISENPIILLRDTLLYPTPCDPFNSVGWLRRQQSTAGPILKMGKSTKYA